MCAERRLHPHQPGRLRLRLPSWLFHPRPILRDGPVLFASMRGTPPAEARCLSASNIVDSLCTLHLDVWPEGSHGTLTLELIALGEATDSRALPETHILEDG